MVFELIPKHAFLNDIVLLERSVLKKVPRALEAIRISPHGPGTRKIRKESYKNLYRYRIGDHRICYSMGTGCIALLAIGPRDQIYDRFFGSTDAMLDEGTDLNSAELQVVPTAVEDSIPDSLPDGEDEASLQEGIQHSPGRRSTELLRGLLESWKVPTEFHDQILTCSEPEELLELGLDEITLEKVLHWQSPPNLEQVIEQPSYELPSPDDLEGYAEGSLTGFLLRLDPEQKKAVDRGSIGPLLVRGGPGTGKSIVALYRIRNLFAPQAQQELFKGEPPRVLFVTYTRALTNASAQMLKVLLGDQASNHVTVRTLDAVANSLTNGGTASGRLSGWQERDRALLARLKVDFPGEPEKQGALREAVDRLEPDYLAEEFDWVIDGRGIESKEEYLEVDRSGRGIGLDERNRTAVWAVYETWRSLLKQQETMTYTQVQIEALEKANRLSADGKYDIVVLDEAQDLKPVGIRLAMALCKSVKGFYLTADAAQSIYGRGFSWKSVSDELKLQGRSVVLRRNYRCTQQIQDAAVAFLSASELEEPEQEAVAVRQGPNPVCQECDGRRAKVIADTFLEWSRDLRLPIWMSAVLVRSHDVGEELAEELEAAGLPARWVVSKDLDLEAKFVKVMTIHAAKGLEFPMVAIAGLESSVFPVPKRQCQAEEDYDEFLGQEQRLFHVGMSRAMRRLIVTFPKDNPSRFIADLDSDLWEWRES